MKNFKYLKKHKALIEPKKEVVNDGELFKVSKVVDVPKKIVNALIKKAKEESGKDPKIFWNEVAIAEEIVKYILNTHLNSDSLPASILIGETSLAAGSEDIIDDVDDAEGEIAADLEIEEPAEEISTEEEIPVDDETTGEDVPSLDSEEDLGGEAEEEAEEATEEV